MQISFYIPSWVISCFEVLVIGLVIFRVVNLVIENYKLKEMLKAKKTAFNEYHTRKKRKFLTSEEIAQIKDADSSVSNAQLSRIYGVSSSHIWSLRKNSKKNNNEINNEN